MSAGQPTLTKLRRERATFDYALDDPMSAAGAAPVKLKPLNAGAYDPDNGFREVTVSTCPPKSTAPAASSLPVLAHTLAEQEARDAQAATDSKEHKSCCVVM